MSLVDRIRELFGRRSAADYGAATIVGAVGATAAEESDDLGADAGHDAGGSFGGGGDSGGGNGSGASMRAHQTLR